MHETEKVKGGKALLHWLYTEKQETKNWYGKLLSTEKYTSHILRGSRKKNIISFPISYVNSMINDHMEVYEIDEKIICR